MTTDHPTILLVDIHATNHEEQVTLSVRCPNLSKSTERVLDDAGLKELQGGLDRLAKTERAHRDRPQAGLPTQIAAHGKALYCLLDGPERVITSALEAATQSGSGLNLIIRLRGNAHIHPGSNWRLELLHDDRGPLGCRNHVTITVQLGNRDAETAEVLGEGRLRYLFMAYSPIGVEPVLDYEGEEEAILRALAPAVQTGRATVEVVEDGSLSELERRLKSGRYDVVHLSGHGELRPDGPCLLMEDGFGGLERVGTERLFAVLERAQQMPRLVVLASCETADGRDDLASMTAGLVRRGVPAAVGWSRPVADTDATQAAKDLYDRLTAGASLPEAAAFARRKLEEVDRGRTRRTFGWATMHLVARAGLGFQLDVSAPPPPLQDPVPAEVYRFLGAGEMRVLQEGFVGRRRPLQQLGRILRDGRDDKHLRAGALILGMKGQGKSCLAGRAIDRHIQASGHVGLLVVHGSLDEVTLLERLRTLALERRDSEAEMILDNASEALEQRLERLLLGPWSRTPLIIVLDDFEQNLEVRSTKAARLKPAVARLLDVILPACRTGKPKVLITCTAVFELSTAFAEMLAEIELGPMEPADVKKLWTRGQQPVGTATQGDLERVSPVQWEELAARLGRNARVLDWARALIGGRKHAEVEELVRSAQRDLPDWRDGVLDEEKQANLAALFLFHAAIDRAQEKLPGNVRSFLDRARVYEIPVGAKAFEALAADLELELEHQLPALANLGLLEFGSFRGNRAYRVNPLVVPQLEGADVTQWHRHAAEYFSEEARTDSGGWPVDLVMQAWEHALAGRFEPIACGMGRLMQSHFYGKGLYRLNHELAERHYQAFPEEFFPTCWSGETALYVGELSKSLRRFSSAEKIVEAGNVKPEEETVFLHSFAGVLHAQGDLAGARQRLERSLEIEAKVHGTEEHPSVAASLHELARVLHAQGDLAGARQRLERSLEIQAKVHGTEEHPEVAASLHELARVLHAQGDLAAARQRLERSLEIKAKVHGTEEHPSVAASLHELAGVLHAQGDLAGARQRLERSLEIKAKVHGTEEHPEVAASLHELAGVFQAQGDLAGARQRLERSLEIKAKVHGTEEHPSVAASLHALAGVFQAQGDLAGARQRLERSLEIKAKVHGTEEHPSVAASLHELARVLHAQGDLAGARQRLERSLEIQAKVHGTEEHPEVAASLHELAGVLQAQGDLAGARQRLERSLEIEAKVHGTEEHPSVAASLHALAGVFQAQGDLAGARQRLERSLEIQAKVHGTEEHPSVAASLHALAGVFQAQGDLAGARQRLERSLEIQAKVHGTEEHPSVAASLHELAGVLKAQGDIPEAIAGYRRVLTIESKIYGTREHYSTAETEIVLGMLLVEVEDPQEGRELIIHGLTVLKRDAPGHPLLKQFRDAQKDAEA